MDLKFRTIGVVSSVVAGICLFLGHFLDWFQNNLAGTTLSHLLNFSGHLVALFAFIAIYEVIYSKKNVFTSLSMIFCVIGTVLVNTPTFSDSLIAINVGISGSIVFGVGMIVFSIEIIRTKFISKYIGICFILGTSMFIIPSFMPSNVLLLFFVGSVITCSGFLLTSLDLLNKKI